MISAEQKQDPIEAFRETSNELQRQAFELAKYSQIVKCLQEAKRLSGEIKNELQDINFDFSFLEKTKV